MHTLKQGFTLIELMIVVAIIAILAALAIPAYQDYVISAQVAEGLELSGAAKLGIWDYVAYNGSLPTDNAAAGLPSPSSITGTYVSAVKVANGVVQVGFNQPDTNQAIQSGTLLLSPVAHGGSISWRCHSSTLEGQYLPTSCR